MNVKLRSSKMVMRAGMTWPLWAAVLVVRLREVHDIDAVGAQGRADRRSGSGLAGGQLQGQDGADLLGHGFVSSYLVGWAAAGLAG